MNKPRLPFDIEYLMESVLNEDPDGVFDEDGDQITHWGDSGAHAFIIFDKFSIIADGGITHQQIMYSIEHASRDGRPDVFIRNEERGVEISNDDGFLWELEHGGLRDAIESGDANEASFYREEFGLSGRVWTIGKQRIISFWNPGNKVIKNWGRVEQMFRDFSGLGDLDDYDVEFIDRYAGGSSDGDTSAPLVWAKTLSSKTHGKRDDKQMNFFDKLSPEQLKKLQSKIHTMPPEKKKQALLAMGIRNTKASNIAEKLGMTVAELNHIMNVNEGVLNEDPDAVYDPDGEILAAWFEQGGEKYGFIILDEFSSIRKNGKHDTILDAFLAANRSRDPAHYMESKSPSS